MTMSLKARQFNIGQKMLNKATLHWIEPALSDIEKLVKRYNELTNENLTIEHCLTYFFEYANHARKEYNISIMHNPKLKIEWYVNQENKPAYYE